MDGVRIPKGTLHAVANPVQRGTGVESTPTHTAPKRDRKPNTRLVSHAALTDTPPELSCAE